MGKPDFHVYEAFRKKYFELCRECGKEQYLVPYLMSSHPGSTLSEAIDLALCLKRDHYAPEQVQDYYPTPGTASTVMYYTGINPLTMKKVYVATDYHEKQLQRALLQFNRPQNADLVREALTKAGRTDLIGNGKDCLVRPAASSAPSHSYRKSEKSKTGDKKATNRGTAPRAKNGKGKPTSSDKQRTTGAVRNGKPNSRKKR
jgi:hypothetical protein